MAQDDAPLSDAPVATTSTFEITAGEVLDWLNRLSAPQVLEEMILEALVEQRAEALGIELPDQETLLAEYATFLKQLAAARGFDDDQMAMEDLVEAANIEGHFADAGLTRGAVLRRIRIHLLSDAIMAHEIDITDAEVEEEMPRVRPLVVTPEQRKIGIYIRDSETEAANLAAELRSLVDRVRTDVRENGAHGGSLVAALQVELPDWQHDDFFAAPTDVAEVPPLIHAAFDLPAVGSVSDPIDLGGRFAVVVVLRLIAASDAILGADTMDPAELEAARERIETRVREAVRQFLMDERISQTRGEWLTQLRENGDVEILWEPPSES
jgi:hypothetical protein